MIVWLASYPRSGNTLLRTVLKQTMGLDSFPERTEWPRCLAQGADADPVSGYIGELPPPEPWETFYPRARESPELYLIKTHEVPFDDGPAIYVVRDGRKASYSYHHYHRAYLANLERTLMQIVVGDDYYGDWTSHYHAWANRTDTASLLLLRYEELHDASPELTARIAAFLKQDIAPRPWVNPFEKVRQLNPHSFREGVKQWMDPLEWDDEVKRTFALFHSPLMKKLGYPMDEERPLPAETEGILAAKIMSMLESGLDQRRCIPRTAEEKRRISKTLALKIAGGEGSVASQGMSVDFFTNTHPS